MISDVKNFQTIGNQINSHKKLILSRAHWIKNDVTDKYLSFVLNFMPHENANNTNFRIFRKKTLLVDLGGPSSTGIFFSISWVSLKMFAKSLSSILANRECWIRPFSSYKVQLYNLEDKETFNCKLLVVSFNDCS